MHTYFAGRYAELKWMNWIKCCVLQRSPDCSDAAGLLSGLHCIPDSGRTAPDVLSYSIRSRFQRPRFRLSTSCKQAGRFTNFCIACSFLAIIGLCTRSINQIKCLVTGCLTKPSKSALQRNRRSSSCHRRRSWHDQSDDGGGCAEEFKELPLVRYAHIRISRSPKFHI